MTVDEAPDEFQLMDSRNSFAWNLLCDLRRQNGHRSEIVTASEILIANITDPTDGAVVVWHDADDLRQLDETAWGVDQNGNWSDCYEAPLVWCDQQDEHSLIIWYSARYGEKGE